MPYTLKVMRVAEHQLADLPKKDRDQLRAAIRSLSDNPKPAPPLGKKLVGHSSRYRLKVLTYRVIYRVDSKAQIVTVEWVGRRRDAYR